MKKIGDYMLKHDETIVHIKSAILDKWNENILTSVSASEWFQMFTQVLNKYFGITESHFMLYDLNSFIPLNFNHSVDKKVVSLPWTQIEHLFQDKNVADISFVYDSKDMDSAVLFQTTDGNLQGLLLVKSTERWESFANSTYIEEFSSIATYLIINIKTQILMAQKEKQYRELFNVTEMFHSTMDIDRILEGVLLAMTNAFPLFQTELVLSNDQNRQTKVPFKLFDYVSERTSAIESFVSGDITSELASDLDCRLLNAPIKGRQGIYGILQVRTPEDYLFSNRQEDFIRMLANTSGNALENAKLYHQSHRLIADLQLINETSHKLNMNLKLEEMLQFLQKQLMKSFHPMETCFVFINEEQDTTTSSTSDIMSTCQGQDYINYTSTHFKESSEPLFIADYEKTSGVSGPFQSLMAVPMYDQQVLSGFCMVLHKNPYFFSFDSFKLMQSLIHHCALAITNSKLREKMQKMVDHDHLTQLYARGFLDQFVEKSFNKDQSGVFILLDIDNFKQVNDTFGHQVGDKVLVQIAQFLETVIDGKGIGARWGGEELAIYLPCVGLDEGKQIGLALVDMVPKMTSPSVTISTGLATWSSPNQSAFHEVFHAADTALYQAKNNGKNQLCIYDVHVSS
ncbi:MAG: diguanylate cyclase domain-containing protein [Paenisporosarcina sp.]